MQQRILKFLTFVELIGILEVSLNVDSRLRMPGCSVFSSVFCFFLGGGGNQVRLVTELER